MNLKEFTTKTYNAQEWNMRPRIICKDGFSMSVQGHAGSYASPRYDSTTYLEMEIGFPSKEEPLIMEFAEDKSSPTGTVYGWVDCSIIQSVIDKHGGIDEEKTFGQLIEKQPKATT